MIFLAPTSAALWCQEKHRALGLQIGHSLAVSTTISAELAAQLGITSAPTEVYIDVKSKNSDGSFVAEIESAEDETAEHASGAEPADEWPATMRTTV